MAYLAHLAYFANGVSAKNEKAAPISESGLSGCGDIILQYCPVCTSLLHL